MYIVYLIYIVYIAHLVSIVDIIYIFGWIQLQFSVGWEEIVAWPLFSAFWCLFFLSPPLSFLLSHVSRLTAHYLTNPVQIETTHTHTNEGRKRGILVGHVWRCRIFVRTCRSNEASNTSNIPRSAPFEGLRVTSRKRPSHWTHTDPY